MEIDVNPLIMEGSTPVAADGLVILDPAQSEPGRTYRAPYLAPLFAAARRCGHRASDDLVKWGGSLLKNIIDGDFAGPI